MTVSEDALNCLKNLVAMMCRDGRIDAAEKKFLAQAARELGLVPDDWNALVKDVMQDPASVYPVYHKDKAAATLKILALMAKADGQVHEKEKQYLKDFAQMAGLNRSEWKQILSETGTEGLFEPFQKVAGKMLIVREDFDQIDALVKVARSNDVQTRIAGMREYLQETGGSDEVVCFHAAAKTEDTMARCRALLEKSGDRLVCILTRFQGLQVKYLLEIGLKKCIIEPVYAHDILGLYSGK